jgi:hypothetical protein
MKEHDKWRDQHDKLVTEVTPEESIRLCVKEITTKTKDTPISYQQERVVKVYSRLVISGSPTEYESHH